jgi:quercetin dioxygenase-like cupin family protein
VRVHHNEAAGETLVVHDDGPLLRAELMLGPVHHAPPAHVHPRATERFAVLEGAVRIRVGRERRVLGAGESFVVPAATVHGYAGVPGTAARIEVELDPAGGMARFFADMDGIDAARRDPATGAPRVRSAAAVLRRHGDDITVPGLPRLLLDLLGRPERPHR